MIYPRRMRRICATWGSLVSAECCVSRNGVKVSRHDLWIVTGLVAGYPLKPAEMNR